MDGNPVSDLLLRKPGGGRDAQFEDAAFFRREGLRDEHPGLHGPDTLQAGRVRIDQYGIRRQFYAV